MTLEEIKTSRNCFHCDKKFYPRPVYANSKNRGKYCSRDCFLENKKRNTFLTDNFIKQNYGAEYEILYKESIREPYVPSGKGIAGAIIYNKETDKVICNDCRKEVSHLGNHIRGKHPNYKGISEYKTKHGLMQKTPLVSRRISETFSRIAIKNHKDGKLHLGGELGLRNPMPRKDKATMQYRNIYDLCDAQIIRRLGVIANMCGKKVSNIDPKDIHRNDPKLYGFLGRKFGSVSKACTLYKLNTIEVRDSEDDELITIMRQFVISNGFIPILNKWIKLEYELPTYDSYRRRYGSWKRAKQMMGLGELLQDVLIQRSQQKVLDRL
jgi:hypothetical protein